MSPQPRRDTTAGRIYNDLRNLARRQGQPTDELFQLYLLERFLFRLAHSPLDGQLVLKGGTLLAAYQLRRPPRTSTCRPCGCPATSRRSNGWSDRSARSRSTTG